MRKSKRKTMRTICTILCLLCLTILPVQIEAATPSSKKTVIKKVRRDKIEYKEGIRTAPRLIQCNISIEHGIQPIDTSDIYLYYGIPCFTSRLPNGFIRHTYPTLECDATIKYNGFSNSMNFKWSLLGAYYDAPREVSVIKAWH